MKKILFLLFLLPLFVMAQDGANDPTFNPNDIGFGYGSEADNNVYATAVQEDGKILVGGAFENYDGSKKKGIVRLNTDGSIDNSFNVPANSKDEFIYVYSILIQLDKKIIIGGAFKSYNGISRNFIARLNTDGSLDETFTPGTGADNSVLSMALQSDGKILIAGVFTTYNGVGRNRIARLNTDGSLDQSFNPGSGADNYVRAVAVQADGKILAGGDFFSWNSKSTNHNFVRLNADGSLDETFLAKAGSIVSAIAIQPNGKILVGGIFTSFNGVDASRIVRLKTDGSIDESLSFDSGAGFDGAPRSIVIQLDGKIIVGGHFFYYDGKIRNKIARLNVDGTIDELFNPGTGGDNNIMSVSIQLDGKVIIGGFFKVFNGENKYHITRLNSNGSLDNSFSTSMGTGANGEISALNLQPDGKIIIAGNFTKYNGISRNRIARLNTDGSLDETFNPGSGANASITAIAIQNDGKIIIGGYFKEYNGISRNRIARLNTNGSLDEQFNVNNTYSEIYGDVQTIALQSDGKVLIGGSFLFYFQNMNSVFPKFYFIRVNPNGALDESFETTFSYTVDASEYAYNIRAIVVQPDDKIIVGGSFNRCNDTPRNGIARLHPNGSLDNTFDTGIGENNVNIINLEPSGKVLIVRGFALSRINTDGSLDQSFISSVANNSIKSIGRQPDGKIIAVGSFTKYNDISQNYITRLNTDGRLDNTFNPGAGASSVVNAVAVQSVGKIILAGNFTSYSGIGRNRIARTTCLPPVITPIGDLCILKSTATLKGIVNDTTSTVNWYNVATAGTSLKTGLSYETPTITTPIAYYADATNSCGTLPRTLIATVKRTPDSKTTQSGNALIATQSDATYQWLSCDSDTTSIAGENDKIFLPGESGSYAVEVNKDGCIATSNCVAFIFTSVEQNTFGTAVNVSPNPVSGVLTVSVEQSFHNGRITLVNLSGQTVTSQSDVHGNSFTFDLSGQPTGLYVMEIADGNRVARIKIIKE